MRCEPTTAAEESRAGRPNVDGAGRMCREMRARGVNVMEVAGMQESATAVGPVWNIGDAMKIEGKAPQEE